MKLCPYCSGEMNIHDSVCTHCGKKITNEKSKPKQEQTSNQNSTFEEQLFSSMGLEKIGPLNKWVTLVLCVFLGFLGAHKLYERKYTMAIVYLLTGGFCGLGIILDIFLILQKPTEYYVYKQSTNNI